MLMMIPSILIAGIDFTEEKEDSSNGDNADGWQWWRVDLQLWEIIVSEDDMIIVTKIWVPAELVLKEQNLCL